MNKTEMLTRGRELLDEVSLGDIDLELDRAKQRAGCYHVRERRITLSEYFVARNDWDLVRQTLLHEAAHALQPYDGHGEVWKAQCRNLGIPARRAATTASK